MTETTEITAAGVEQALAGLDTTPPDDLRDRILDAAGIAYHAVVDGPLGPVVVVFTSHGVSRLVPAEHWAAHPTSSIEMDEVPGPLRRKLERAFSTGRVGNLPLDLSALTEFQRKVLEKTIEIPPGELRPYGWVAREIGSPGAVRAVGSALNRNPVPIIVPCHRVNRGDGFVGNYGYGPEMKRDLLAAEGLDPDEVDRLAEQGVRFVGSDTTHVYCLPSCRHARRITPAHRVRFGDARRAEQAGYRPCAVCRPAVVAA